MSTTAPNSDAAPSTDGAPKRRPVRKRVRLALAIIAVLAVALLWGLDALLWHWGQRSRIYRTGPGAGGVKAQSYDWNDNLSNALLFAYDHELAWRLRPGAKLRLSYVTGLRAEHRFDVAVNRFGLRGPGIAPRKSTGTRRVFCLGDSRTYGQGVAVQETFAALVGPLVSARLPGVRVESHNAGVPGYSSFQGVRWARRLLRLEPDAFVFCFSANDLTPRPRSDRQVYEQTSAWRGRLLETLDHSMIYLRLRQLLRGPGAGLFRPSPGQVLKPRVGPSALAANMLEFFGLCEAAGAAPVVVCLPAYDHGELIDGPYDPIIRHTAREAGVAIVDFRTSLAPLRRRVPWLYLDHGYLNAEGHRLLAEQIAERLAQAWAEQGT